MPTSFVIYCQPEIDVSKRAYMGKGLYDGFIDLLAQLDSQMAQRISRSKTSPLTLSPLFGRVTRGVATEERHGMEKLIRESSIRAGTPCRLRVSFLDDSVGERAERILGESGEGMSLSIGGTPLRITDTVFSHESADPWVSRRGYRELYEDASPSMRKATLQFVTATAFKRHGENLPLPDPQLVFRGYLDYWRWFSFIPLSSDFMQVIDQSILLKEFNISPIAHEIDDRKQHGFTGWCRFLLAGRHHEKHIREFNALADYSFYCSTGRNTSMGMGVTKRV